MGWGIVWGDISRVWFRGGCRVFVFSWEGKVWVVRVFRCFGCRVLVGSGFSRVVWVNFVDRS